MAIDYFDLRKFLDSLSECCACRRTCELKMKATYNNITIIFGRLPKVRRWQAIGLFVLMIFGSAAEVVSISAFVPLLSEITSISTVAEATQSSETAASGISAILLFALAYTVANILKLSFRWFELRFQADITHDLARISINTIVNKEYLEIVTTDSSQFLGNLLHDVDETGGFIRSSIALLNSLLISLALFITVFVLNPNVASYIAIGLLLTYAAVTACVRAPLRNNGKLISNSVAQRSKILREVLSHFELIKISRNFNMFLDPFFEADWAYRLRRIINTILVSVPRYAFETVGALLVCGYLGVVLASGGNKSEAIILVGTFALSATRLLPALQQMFQSVGSIFTTQAAVHKIKELLSQHCDTISSLHGERLASNACGSIEKVCFKFPAGVRGQDCEPTLNSNLKTLKYLFPRRK